MHVDFIRTYDFRSGDCRGTRSHLKGYGATSGYRGLRGTEASRSLAPFPQNYSSLSLCSTFRLIKSAGPAGPRLGEITTSRGVIDTPVFMPVGTYATVKTLTPEDLQEIGAGIILSNTYHLYLRPGVATIAALGGLHRFMHWDGPILTDSGGYQIFSLAPFRTMSEEGVTFRSHLDGSSHFLTPETVVGLQEALGVDIMICLDECPGYPAPEAEVAKAAALTLRWAARSPGGPDAAPTRPSFPWSRGA